MMIFLYKRIFVDMSGKKIVARVEHFTGKTIVSVSSDTPEIKQYLFSTQDSSAVINVARVLADRCLQFGINQIHFLKDIEFEKSKKMQLFYKTLIDNGLQLEEPEFIDKTSQIPGLNYEEKDFYTDPLNLPFPPEVNRRKKKILEEATN
jgi:large subunit ribosomal protein L18